MRCRRGVLEQSYNPPSDMVLKREFSNTSIDVYLLDLWSKSKASQVWKAAVFIKERSVAEPDAKCSWLAQEYVPCLTFGEFRYMCVGGNPTREVVTGLKDSGTKDIWSFKGNNTLRSLLSGPLWPEPNQRSKRASLYGSSVPKTRQLTENQG